MCQKQPIEITRTIKTNGGWMFDVEVDDNQQLSRYDNSERIVFYQADNHRHTVLLGKNLFEELADHTNSTPETVVITVFRYLIVSCWMYILERMFTGCVY